MNFRNIILQFITKMGIMKLTAKTFKRGITPKGATKKAPLLSS